MITEEVNKTNQRTDRHNNYIFRPATRADLPAVAEMLNHWSQHAQGVTKFEANEIGDEWDTPGFSLEGDTCLAFAPDGTLAAYYELWDLMDNHSRINLWGRVHPAYTRQGIGSALLEWAEGRARRSIPLAPYGQRVVLATSSLTGLTEPEKLFLDHGFSAVRYFLRMVINLDGQETYQPKWPVGIQVRALRPGVDETAAVMAVRDSFRDHWGYVVTPLEEEMKRWKHLMETFEYFDPALWFLAWDGDEVAGVSLCYERAFDDPNMGWVGTLGVRRPWRRQGLAMALLMHSFADFARRGRTRAGLGVDASSLTGATRLYEKAGMHSDPAWQMTAFHKELRPGFDPSTQSLENIAI